MSSPTPDPRRSPNSQSRPRRFTIGTIRQGWRRQKQTLAAAIRHWCDRDRLLLVLLPKVWSFFGLTLQCLIQVRGWWQRILRIVSRIGHGWWQLKSPLISALKWIGQRNQLLAILLLLLWVLVLIGHLFVHGVSRFEGRLITQSMSFTYIGEVDKQFLNSLSLPKLTLQGKQPEALLLKGQFSSPDDPVLNTQLKRLTQLEIQLPDSRSGITFDRVDVTQPNSIYLQQLRILPNTHVEQLAYQIRANQLHFCLQSSTVEGNGCEDRNAVESDPTPVGRLEFGVSSAPIRLFLSNVEIPALGISESTLETQVRWQPVGQDFILPISSPTAVQLRLPTVSKNVSAEVIDDLTQLIRGDILVSRVRFSQLNRSGNINDDILTSDILDGEIRMMGQSLKLQPNQFLIIPTDRPYKESCRMAPTQPSGIQRLRGIRLNLKEPRGLETLISGESKCLAIGFYPEFPAEKIEPSWLLHHVPQEGINAIYTLLGAFTGILFPLLLPENGKNTPKQKEILKK